jgi:transposase-like protein
LQQALEDEVTEFLGRRRYERAEETVSHRNGHEQRTVKTTSGAMRLQRPRIRDASRLGFESRILGKGVARTHALESLVISGFLRGLSTRDIEAALEEVSRSRSRRSRRSPGSVRTSGSDTASGAAVASSSTTSSTCSWMRSI